MILEYLFTLNDIRIICKKIKLKIENAYFKMNRNKTGLLNINVSIRKYIFVGII